MKPEAQRIAIAEADGWEFPVDLPAQRWAFIGYKRHPAGPEDDYSEIVPDYPNDLNAMHKAEGVLSIDQFAVYVSYLRSVTLRDAPDNSDLPGRLVMATATQRAEAFLKTLGKWTND